MGAKPFGGVLRLTFDLRCILKMNRFVVNAIS
jgi:hypothetical protein